MAFFVDRYFSGHPFLINKHMNMSSYFNAYWVLTICLVGSMLWSCSKDIDSNVALFELLDSEATGIDFRNQIKNTEAFNIFSYRNFYNGGGVAIGDINNDGWPDVYLTANMGQNKLYLNQGDFQFEDITEKAKVALADRWSTGVVMVDVNADGWLDIYVCNAGYGSAPNGDPINQKNSLFLNNGDLTFEEAAQPFGLDDTGYTTHAAFFDYDLDGDLDAYLLNNSFIPVNTLNFNNRRDLPAKDWPVKDFLKGGGDRLLRNDNGVFADVSEQAGIYQSLIGFGLGITVGDINGDRWPDMYISNDFYERDYLYINQQNGTFKEDITNWMEHISLASMGADMADLNNDGLPEIFVTEMLPESDERRKTTTRFENYEIFQIKQQRGFEQQYMHNTLQFNNGNGTFSEIAHYSGVAASDWSWGALLFDADNDGWRDIYVCNGVFHDVTNQDFIDFFADEVVQEMALTGKKREMEKVIEQMPSTPLPNKFFQNNQDYTFEDMELEWGTNIPSFSNGAAYGDLDLDGDLDLVVNNLNQEAFVLQNHSDQVNENHFMSISLQGASSNPFAVGARVNIHMADQIHNMDLIPTRGFQSSVDYRLVFGLGKRTEVDSVVIIWPDQSLSIDRNPMIDTINHYIYAERMDQFYAETGHVQETLLQEFPMADLPVHQEDEYVDFYSEGLVMRMVSKEGPVVATADVNGDERLDLYFAGAKNQAGTMWLQTKAGFQKKTPSVFVAASELEETAAVFFDADQDGDQDLYVGIGGNFSNVPDQYFRDLLYINDGKGHFTRSKGLPAISLNTSVVVPLDFDEDGDLDLFVGSRSIPGLYGVPPKQFILENNGLGTFRAVTTSRAPQLERIGMVTDAVWADVLPGGGNELVIVGEWMAPTIFRIRQGVFQMVTSSLSNYPGWYYAVEVADLDQDGDQDLVLGNRGKNFYFDAHAEAPAKLWLGDFDQNRTIEKVITHHIDGKDKPIHMKRELTDQLVNLKKANLKHNDYAEKSIQELIGEEQTRAALVKEATFFYSAYALFEDTSFTVYPFPEEVQFSCVCGIACQDINDDGQIDLILGGNDSGFLPQFSKLDASFGHVLLNKDGHFELQDSKRSGFLVRGEIRQIEPFSWNNENFLFTVLNNEGLKMHKIMAN